MVPTEKLTIDTPEQIALELPLAGIGSRSLALAYDTLLQFLIYVALFAVAAVSSSISGIVPRFWGTALAAFLVLAFFCVYWCYFIFFEILWNGQTPGKSRTGIRVIDASGRPLSAVQAIGRNLMRVIDWLPGVYGVGIVCMMLNAENKRLGDYVAGTVVVHDKTTQQFKPDWDLEGAPKPGHQPEVEHMTADELVILETFLHRRFELPRDVRRQSAAQIVRMITSRTKLEPKSGQPHEGFIETIAREIRDSARFRP